MQVVYTPVALADLREIGDYIAIDNRRRAQSFIFELREACSALLDEPLRYRCNHNGQKTAFGAGRMAPTPYSIASWRTRCRY